jgi:hypothetical protein
MAVTPDGHRRELPDISWSYPGSALERRMKVLIRMRELGMSRAELADATGIDAIAVLEVNLHTPDELARLAIALDWPPDHLTRPWDGAK